MLRIPWAPRTTALFPSLGFADAEATLSAVSLSLAHADVLIFDSPSPATHSLARSRDLRLSRLSFHFDLPALSTYRGTHVWKDVDVIRVVIVLQRSCDLQTNYLSLINLDSLKLNLGTLVVTSPLTM